MLTGSYQLPDCAHRLRSGPFGALSRAGLRCAARSLAIALLLAGSLLWAQEKRPGGTKPAPGQKPPPATPAADSTAPAKLPANPPPLPGEVGPTEYLVRDKD